MTKEAVPPTKAPLSRTSMAKYRVVPAGELKQDDRGAITTWRWGQRAPQDLDFGAGGVESFFSSCRSALGRGS